MHGTLAALHGLATLLFVLGSAVVSVRLLLLARRTREAPELLLGLGILLTAVLGYGVLILDAVLHGAPEEPQAVTAAGVALRAAGRVLHDAGVTCFLVFVVRVFRPGQRWAHALAGGAALLLWSGLGAQVATGGLRVATVGSLPWLAEYLVIWSYPVWVAAEAYRYGILMRRRQALGLAQPLVTHRFLLWGTGALFTGLATWVASVPFLLAHDPAALAAATPAVRVLTALAGVVSITCTLFAFLPPAWYRRRLEPEPTQDGTAAVA